MSALWGFTIQVVESKHPSHKGKCSPDEQWIFLSAVVPASHLLWVTLDAWSGHAWRVHYICTEEEWRQCAAVAAVSTSPCSWSLIIHRHGATAFILQIIFKSCNCCARVCLSLSSSFLSLFLVISSFNVFVLVVCISRFLYFFLIFVLFFFFFFFLWFFFWLFFILLVSFLFLCLAFHYTLDFTYEPFIFSFLYILLSFFICLLSFSR